MDWVNPDFHSDKNAGPVHATKQVFSANGRETQEVYVYYSGKQYPIPLQPGRTSWEYLQITYDFVRKVGRTPLGLRHLYRTGQGYSQLEGGKEPFSRNGGIARD